VACKFDCHGSPHEASIASYLTLLPVYQYEVSCRTYPRQYALGRLIWRLPERQEANRPA